MKGTNNRIDEEKLRNAEEQFKKGLFTLDDYLSQLRQMKKMGGMEGVLSLLPGVNKIKEQMDNASIDEKIITTNEAIILSMTKKEREEPKEAEGVNMLQQIQENNKFCNPWL